MSESCVQSPIAIVGMAALFPKSPGLKAYWRLLRRAEDAVSEVPESHWRAADYFDADPKAPDMTYCQRGAFLSPVDFDPLALGIPPSALEATDTAQLLGLVAAQDALDDAGYGESGREFDCSRASVILGVTGTLELVVPLGARLGHPHWRRALEEAGVDEPTIASVIARISDAYVGWQESSFPGLLGNVVAGRIANRLDLKGTNCVVDAACASSLSAIHLAALELNAGKSDLVLTGGVDTFNDIFMFMCFSKTQALSLSGDARPFAAAADGTVLGEGVGIVVLKRLADAERDGDRIYAVLRGMGTSSDGRSQSIYAPRAAGQAEALRDAYACAGISPSDIGMVEAHGTGTKVGDAVEFEALSEVYGEAGAGHATCALGSVKSQIGHTKAAAGAASIIKAALALYHRTLPATIKIDAPHPKLDLADGPLYLNTQTRPWISAAEHPRRAGVSSFGFGGSNFHAVLEEYPQGRREPHWDGSVEIVALSGATKDELSRELADLSVAARDGFMADSLAALANASRRAFDAPAACRLICIVTIDDDPAAVFERAARLLGQRGESNWTDGGIAFGSGDRAGRLAFLFPGQGSQYVGMGRDLVCCFPEAHAAVAEADADYGGTLGPRIYPPPAFDTQQRSRYEAELTATEVAQPALGAISLGMLRVLSRFGVAPDVTCGHSFGELVALCAAARLDDAALRRLARMRGALMAANGEEAGAMAAVAAPLDELEVFLTGDHPQVVLANRNGPSQGVISGPRAALAKASDACTACGWRVTPLAVSRAFHSPLMVEAQAGFAAELARVDFARAGLPVLANAHAAAYPDDAGGARELLARQIVEPVRFREQIEQLYADGVRTYVEVGPKTVLSNLVGRILADRPHTTVPLDASNGRGDGIIDLARALARVAAAGHAVGLASWENYKPRARKPKMIVPLVGANYRAPRSTARQVFAKGQTKMNPDYHPGASADAPESATPAGDLAGIYQVVQEGLRAMQALQQQTASAHQRFLEGQEQAHRTFHMVMESQQRLFEKLAGLPVSALAADIPAQISIEPPVGKPSQTTSPRISTPATAPTHASAVTPSAPAPTQTTAAVNSLPATVAQAAPAVQPARLAPVLLEVVAELTGYPPEMLALEMDMEADLGIDSIKRVEILAAVQEKLPALRQVESSHMGSLRTLADIVAHMEGAAVAGDARDADDAGEAALAVPQPATGAVVAPVPAGGDFAPILLGVVAELTGYPGEMLALEMDMEADLGIDSIKRVEILAAVQEKLPDLRQVDSAHMGSLRTLRDIVDYMSPAATATDVDRETVRAATARERAGAKNARSAQDDPHNGPAPRQQSEPARVIDTNQSLHRQVLEAFPLPAADPQPLVIAVGHEVWVVDDGTDLAKALVERLVAQGIAARVVGSTPPVDGEACAPVGGLIHLFPPADRADATTLDQLRSAFVLTRDLARDLRSAGQQGGAFLVTVSRMDGAFGLRGGDFDPVQGGLAGLLKTAAREWPEVTCRALDIDRSWENSTDVADAVMDALARGGPIEIGLSAGERCGLRLASRPVQPASSRLESGDLVIVSGGARGVTAEAALALAKAHQPTLVLLGRSPQPESEPEWARGLACPADLRRAIMQHEFAGSKPSPSELEAAYRRLLTSREISHNVERIRETGAAVYYCEVDATNRAAVKELVRRLCDDLGPVRGIIHGAGVIEDRLIEDKDLDLFDKVVNTKVVGLQALLEAAGSDDLKCLVLFSSVTGRFGRVGQVDYAMANEVLNKIAHRQAARRPHCRVVAINWGPWDGGMVGDSLKRVFEREGVGLIPLAAGAQALVDELAERDRSAVEVAIGGTFPIEDTQRTDEPAGSVAHGLDVVLERRLDVNSHPFLKSHVIGGRPVLPVAVGMEWLAHGALHAHPGMKLVGLEDIRVLKGVVLGDDPVKVEIAAGSAQRDGGGSCVAVELRSRTQDGALCVHLRARAVLASRYGRAPQQAAGVLGEVPNCDRSAADVYRDVLFHGREFHAIKAIERMGERGAVARLSPAPPPDKWMQSSPRSAWIGDPLMVDGALQLGIVWAVEQLAAPALPSRIAAYRQYVDRMPVDAITARLLVTEHAEHRLTADVDFVDSKGAVVAQLSGCTWTVDASLAESFRRRSVRQTA